MNSFSVVLDVSCDVCGLKVTFSAVDKHRADILRMDAGWAVVWQDLNRKSLIDLCPSCIKVRRVKVEGSNTMTIPEHEV